MAACAVWSALGHFGSLPFPSRPLLRKNSCNSLPFRRVSSVMKRLSAFLLALLALTGLAHGQIRATFDVNGVTREALIHAPEKSDQPVPLVFFFHGHTGTAGHAARRYEVHKAWPEAVFIYPQGLPTPGKTDPEGKFTGWQQAPGEQDNRDVKFFDVMLARARTERKIDDTRIYCMGHSNGAVFTYVLAATRPDTFAALAPSAGTMRILKGRPQPVPVIHFAGTNDPLVTYAGQQFTLRAMRRINQCADTSTPWHPDTPHCELFASSIGAPVVVMTHDEKHAFHESVPALAVRFFKEHTKKPKTASAAN